MQLQVSAPTDVSVQLCFSEGTRTAHFSWAHVEESQLDWELGTRWDAVARKNIRGDFNIGRGGIGIIVDGQLYVDDRVFWLGLLKEGETYAVAYNSKAARAWGWFTMVRDYFCALPLVHPRDIPTPDPSFCSSPMRAALIEKGMLTEVALEKRGLYERLKLYRHGRNFSTVRRFREEGLEKDDICA